MRFFLRVPLRCRLRQVSSRLFSAGYSSDFEEDLGVSVDEAELDGFLRLMEKVKEEGLIAKGEALKFLWESDLKPTKSLVVSAVWELRKDWESGLLAFKWGEDCVSDCPEAWHLMVWALGKQGRFGEAWSVLRRMWRWNMPTRRALMIIMERYVAANEPTKAIRTFHAMEKFNIFPDSVTFYALLRALSRYKNVEEAEELLFIDRKLFPLETEGFNIILDGWCNTMGDVIEAKRVWREMSSRCIYPDATSYTHMIYCIAKSGNLFDSLRLYDEMKKRGWVPEIKVYNALMYVLTKENCLEEAHALFDKIKEGGLKADVDTYNSILHPLCEAHKLHEAHDMLKKMLESGIEPTIETYHAFAKVENLEGTLDLIERMRSVNLGPDGTTFLIIYDKFFRSNQPGCALRLWSQMGSYGIEPDSSLYVKFVEGLLTCGWIPKAWELYQEMTSKGFPPDPKLEKIFKVWILSKNKSCRSRQGKQFDAFRARGGPLIWDKIFS